MNTIERKQLVLQRLEEYGSVNIVELSEELGVSSMTIRRDLAKYAKDGLVRLEYGGAVLNSGSLFEYNMTMKKEQNQEEKQAMARQCLQYIKDGDSIFLDAGTTVTEIAKLIINRKNLTVMTNSLLVANSLAKSKNLKVLMCPGIFRETSMAYMGQLTDSFVNQFRIDVFFLGVEGVSLDFGVTVPDTTDGATKQNLVKHSEKVVCVADSSKFTKSYFYNICPLSEIDVLITDNKLPDEIANKFIEKGVKLIKAE